MSDYLISMPKSIENLQLPDPELLNQYIDLENRVVWIAEEIDTYTLELIKYIMYWNRADSDIEPNERKPIRLIFFSPGGDLDVNNAIIDTITLSKTPVWGINMGRCCSAAAFIYLACNKRFTMPQAYWIFHQGSGTLSGSYNEVVAQMDNYQKQVEELASFMNDRTTYSEEEIANRIVGEWYVSSEEAIENGVCDKVIDDLDEVL